MKRIITLVLAATMVMWLFAGCGSQKVPEASPSESESVSTEPVVISLSGGDYGYPSPYLHYSRGPGSFKMRLVFDSLLEHGEDSIIPWLAESYDVSDDGLTYTFKVRDGVKWQDGEAMTIDDVLFSFQYQIEHPPVSGGLGEDAKMISNMKVESNNFIVTLTQRNAVMLDSLGSIRILPKHIWENVEDPAKFTDDACSIGCGPYKLTNYDKEQGAYEFTAFEDYWGQNQKVDVIRFVPVSDGLLAFDNGEIDLTAITPDIMDKYANSDEYAILKNPGFWGYVMCFSFENAPALQDKNVRQAIAYAIDRSDIIEKVTRGAAILPGDGFIPQESVWYNKNIDNYEFDTEKAKELLGGKTYDFTLTISNSNGEVRMAELMKLTLAEVGINVTVESFDSKTRDTMYKNGEYQLLINGYGGWGSDIDMLRTDYANGGIKGYNNDELNKLCDEQLIETDPQKRLELGYKIQDIIAEDIPQLPIYNTKGMNVYKPAKYDGWKYMFDHHETTHAKISYLDVAK